MSTTEKANGRVGLANLGNTCFLNVIIQSIRYCPGLAAYLYSGAYKLHLKSDRSLAPITHEIADVVKCMWGADVKARATMAPRGFISVAARLSDTAGYPDLVSGMQSDAAEFLQFLLDSIHSGISRQVQMDIVGSPKTIHDTTQIKALQSWVDFYRKEYSIIVENFFGQTQTVATCGHCKAISVKFEPWMMLKVPIPEEDSSPVTLQECFTKAYEKETLSDYMCDSCKNRGPATLQQSISRLPQVLILILKRFNNQGRKISKQVHVDIDDTDISPWLAFPAVAKHSPAHYSTFAIVEHHGSSRGGHYVSYAKDNDTWLNYDDTSVNELNNTTGLVNNNSYIFFMTNKQYTSPVPIVNDSNREE